MHHAIHLGFLLFACATLARAEDITTRSGKVLKQAEVTAISSDRVTIKHASGSEHLAWEDLPERVQQKLKSDSRFAALRRRELEIERLKEQLARAESELIRLQQQLVAAVNDRTLVVITNTPAPASRSEARPRQSLEVLDVRDLVLDFQEDPAAAEARHGKKVFRIQGQILRFDPKAFLRKYAVLLDTGDKAMQVVCHFSYPARVDAVYTKESGKILVGVSAGKGEGVLLETGQTVTIEGKCGGLRAREVAFTGCELVR